MNKKTLKIVFIGFMAALAYIAFTFLQIKIPTPGGFTSFHLGNTFCVLTALLAGGLAGGVSGAIGMGLADLFDPVYVVVAPKTIILKLMIGLITGFIAHRYFHIHDLTGKKLWKAAILSSSAGMLFNIVGEPLFSYFYTSVLLGAPAKAAQSLAAYNAITTTTNAVLAIVIASTLYVAIAPRLKSNGLLKKLAPKENFKR